jgi:hypothetical protein
MQASPDLCRSSRNPLDATRHPALELAFVSICSEEVDIGEWSLTMISQFGKLSGTVEHFFKLTRWEIAQDSQMDRRPTTFFTHPGRSSQCKHARILSRISPVAFSLAAETVKRSEVWR